jgi:gliding motility-associated lipoprotein GldH
MKMGKFLTFVFFTSFVGFLVSCNPGKVYDENISLDNNEWKSGDSLVFPFEITDTTVPYNFLYNVRYSPDYPYYNLYLKHLLYDSSGAVVEVKLMNMNLFDPVSGKPLGDGMGDLFDRQILFINGYRFPYNGKYKLVTKNYMRDEPLKGLESLGLTVKKVENN